MTKENMKQVKKKLDNMLIMSLIFLFDEYYLFQLTTLLPYLFTAMSKSLCFSL